MNIIDDFHEYLKGYKGGMYDKLVCKRAIIWSDNQVLVFINCEDIFIIRILTHEPDVNPHHFSTYAKDKLKFYFDPSPYTDEQIVKKVKLYLTFS